MGGIGLIGLIGAIVLLGAFLAWVYNVPSWDGDTKRGLPRSARQVWARIAAEEAAENSAAEAALRDLMARFQTSSDDQLLRQLIVQYCPLVTYVAERVRGQLPPNIEQRDLVSCGIFGLIDAIEKFGVERAIRFETYAISRIRAAILDEFGANDWIPRSSR